MITRLFFSAVTVFCLTVPACADTQIGPFRPSPALTVYAINETGMDTCRLTARRGPRQEGDRLMIRVFDPAEDLAFWQYAEPGQMRDAFYPGEGEVWGIPIVIPDKILAPGDLFLELDLPLVGAGVHQVRVSAGTANTAVSLSFPEPVRYGLSFQDGKFLPWDAELERAYIYIPPHAEQLELRGKGVSVRNENGDLLASADDLEGGQTLTIPVEHTEVVWTFEFQQPGDWSFFAAGFPVILCPDAETARELRASVEVLPDGTVVCHKFQRRIAELLPELLAPERVGDTAELLALWGDPDPAWFEDPVANRALLNPYGIFANVYAALEQQNLDPDSHWGGAMGKEWQERQALGLPENRWDRLRSVRGLWAGASGNIIHAQALAEAAELETPLNPWYGREELRWRAAAGALRDLMALGEDEVFRGVGADLNNYPGMMPFMAAKKQFPEYDAAAPHLPAPIREVWTEGLRRIVDRHFPDGLVSCMNQSSHWLAGFQHFANGSGDPRYATLARRFAQRFANAASPPGYFIEACGPDATYCGMQHFHMALYYRLSGDDDFLAAIRGSYNFFNHTAAPEPDGRAFGGFNFAHRTPNGVHGEQYGGARGQLETVLPEVALWSSEPTETERREAAEDLRRQLAQPPPEPRSLDLTTPRWRYRGTPVAATWPAAEERSFMRSVGDELIAVKRPAYYTAIYVGRPAHEFYIRGRKVFRQPLPDRAEDAGGDPWNYYYNLHAASPLLGGGVTLFWTPAYGNALIAGNCTPLAHHGLVAIDSEGLRWWEDYHAVRHDLDKPGGTLTITGRIEGQPVTYTRTYRFHDDRLEIGLRLETNEEAAELQDLVENIPLMAGAAKANGMTIDVPKEEPIEDDEGIELATGRGREFAVTDDAGNGVHVLLDGEHDLRLCRTGMNVRGAFRFDRVQIVLPPTIRAGEPVELSYVLEPRQAE